MPNSHSSSDSYGTETTGCVVLSLPDPILLLQTQLRAQVYSKLQESGADVVPPVGQPLSLYHQIMNSLVAEYLADSNYTYSLSVFQPEAGLSGQKQKSQADILAALQINSSSLLHQKLVALQGASRHR